MSNKSYLSVYAKSFSWAGFFLPKKTLEKCSALYDFCRVADNIADDDEKIDTMLLYPPPITCGPLTETLYPNLPATIGFCLNIFVSVQTPEPLR